MVKIDKVWVKWLLVFVMGVLVSGTQTVFCADTIVDSYTKAGLPAAGTAGRIARVTDDMRGLWMDDSAQWVEINGKVLNVKNFGAKGDGVTNDTAAIQAAIDTAAGYSWPYKPAVFLPAGDYLTMSALNFKTTGHQDLYLFGQGKNSMIRHQGTDSAIELGDGITSLNSAHIEKLFILGTSSGDSGIRVRNYHRSTFRDLTIQGYTKQTGYGGAGIKFEYVIIEAVERCELSGNYNGIWTSNTIVNGLEILDCIMSSNTHCGVEIYTGNQVSISGCVFKTLNYGIWVNGAGRGWNFSNNYFEAITTSAIELESALNVGCVIEGNYFMGGSQQEIYIVGGRGWVIRGNAFQTASVNSLIRIKGNTGPATVGMIDGNGVDSGINPSYTFFSNDDSIMDQVIIQNPQTGIYGVYYGTGRRLGIDRNGVQIGETGDIATIKKHLTATATWDPPSLSNGSSAQILLTVNGAVAGDTASASHTQTGTAKINISAYVTAANQVAVVIHNISGGSLNIPSGTVRADVWQY